MLARLEEGQRRAWLGMNRGETDDPLPSPLSRHRSHVAQSRSRVRAAHGMGGTSWSATSHARDWGRKTMGRERTATNGRGRGGGRTYRRRRRRFLPGPSGREVSSRRPGRGRGGENERRGTLRGGEASIPSDS